MQVVETEPGRYRLSGRVDFTNAVALREDVDARLTLQSRVELSFADINDGNSLLVAMMMGWFRHARQLGHEVIFTDVPDLLISLIDFSGLSDVLPVANGGAPAGSGQNSQRHTEVDGHDGRS